MKKLLIIFGMTALASCSLQTKEVLIDDKYDVVVGSQVIKGERVYFINAISICIYSKVVHSLSWIFGPDQSFLKTHFAF